MFELGAEHGDGGNAAVRHGTPPAAPPRLTTTVTRRLSTKDLRAMLADLAMLDTDVPDAERIEQIALLESIKAGAAAAQARATVAFDASQRDVQASRGVPVRERGRGIAAQIALARRDSTAKGSRHLGLARALVTEMPHTLAHLAAGRVSEWRATIVCRETAVLSADDRRRVDALLRPGLPAMGDVHVARTARALAYQIDAGSVVRRVRGAETDRRVGIRPAPDAMALLTGFLPVAQGVAAFAALDARAKELLAQGDPRGRGQIMADTLVERLTGQASADAVPLEIQLVMPAETLLGRGEEPAVLPAHGPLPAAFARELVARCGDTGARQWLRRLFTVPASGSLVAMESNRRRFDGLLRDVVLLRDATCRTPWCDAPIRHIDHVVPDRCGGATSAANAQGLCEACNYAKEAPGWRAEVLSDGPSPERQHLPAHAVRTTTPTGVAYHSTAPPLLTGQRLTGGAAHELPSALERHLEQLLAA